MFELDGLCPELAEEEARSLLFLAGSDGEMERIHNLAQADYSGDIHKLAALLFTRAGMVRSASVLLEGDGWATIGESFRVVPRRTPGFVGGGPRDINPQRIVDMLEGTARDKGVITKGAVRDADTTVIYYIPHGMAAVEVFRRDNNKMRGREPKARPFFMPTSLHPKISRAAVNLCRSESGLLVDPFAGTGGTLMEAALMGFNVVGLEMDPAVARGAKRNMGYYCPESQWDIIVGDALHPPLRRDIASAVVTDLPYGRSTKMNAPADELHRKAVETVAELLTKGGRACVIAPVRLQALEGIEIEKVIEMRVHRSLVRHFNILRRE